MSILHSLRCVRLATASHRSFSSSRTLIQVPQTASRSSPFAPRTYATMPTDPSKWKFNHTMLRVKDPQRSIEFYKFLGLSQINKIAQPEANFDLYFLAYDGPSSCSPQQHWTDREGVLELTHNYGTEKDPNFKVANGNEEPGKGFGHIAISVDNIQAACQRLEDAGYPFQKKLTEGKMRSIAFAKDPDGMTSQD
jgi:lactoylglutathione lyase